MSTPRFEPSLFAFLVELKANNNRDWFQTNKKRYENELKDPMLEWIAAFAEPLQSVSPHLRAIPKANGGSLFRIYRDVRFSKDKSPYKTHAAAQFRHKDKGSDVHTPGFYLHLEPDNVMAGAGIWRPDNPSLKLVREAIVARPKEYEKAIASLPEGAEFKGESLKRPPRGFDADHPLIDDLKRKDFAVLKNFDPDLATKPEFFDAYLEFCHGCKPLMAFLASALKLDW